MTAGTSRGTVRVPAPGVAGERDEPTAVTGQPAAVAQTPWPLRSSLALGALPSAVPCARLHARHVLWEWRLDHLADTVELIVSELVTNSLTATKALPGPIVPPIRLRLSSDHVNALVEVWDGSTEPPVLTRANDAAGSGRGLLLVDTLSARWGWSFPREWGGKVTWALVSE